MSDSSHQQWIGTVKESLGRVTIIYLGGDREACSLHQSINQSIKSIWRLQSLFENNMPTMQANFHRLTSVRESQLLLFSQSEVVSQWVIHSVHVSHSVSDSFSQWVIQSVYVSESSSIDQKQGSLLVSQPISSFGHNFSFYPDHHQQLLMVNTNWWCL